MSQQPEDEAQQARRALRSALGSFLTGVTVVTTTDETGRPRGITANSFTSVSLDPPLVLVCVDVRSASYEAFTTSGGYTINILGQDDQDVAEMFASKRADKFASVSTHTSRLGNPLLVEAITWLDCRTTDVHVVGDHAMLIGAVEEYGGEGGQPLGFHQGRFINLKPLETAALPSTGVVDVAWILEDPQGRVILRPAPEAPGGDRLALPGGRMHVHDLTDDGLAAAALQAAGTAAVIDFLYSFYTDEADGRLCLAYRGRVSDPAQLAAGFRPVEVTDDLWSSLASDVEVSVLKRFREERETQRFGIYAGTAERGSVATIHDVRPDLDEPTVTAGQPDSKESA